MRALGPGSVASLLKIALDCAYAVLLLAVAGIVLAALGLLLVMPFVQGSQQVITLDGHKESVSVIFHRWPALEALLVAAGLYVGALGVIVNRLRHVFRTLTQGDPFRPQNVARLRVVGLGLIALEALGYLVRLAVVWLAPESGDHVKFNISLSGWFAILAVFVLAEVFREGARLRSDAELTI
jgi:hypothetical protein